jgi:hypothetical protein
MPKFPVNSPRTATISSATLTLGGTNAETLRQSRALALLWGPAYDAQDGTVAYADVTALGSALGLTRLRGRAAADEAFIDTASYLLSEWESMLGIARNPGAPTSVRRQRLLARWRALRGGTPQAITIAVTALLNTGDVPTVVEAPVQDVPYAVEAAVFRFAVVLPDTGPAWTYFLDPVFGNTVRQTVDAMKPAHTSYKVTNRIGFRCDDPQSVCDLTLLSS